MSSFKKVILAALVLSPVLASAAEVKAPVVTMNGLVDSYYTLNLTHGQDLYSPTSGFEGAYSSATGFNLNYAKLAATAEAGPATLKLEIGAGKQALLVGDILVQQAYVSMKFGGATVDAGRFYTAAGFEVFDGNLNWNYSKGLLYNFAVPTAHEGVRVGMPINDNLTVTASLANGSDLYTNDVGDTGSPYKTGILSLGYTKEDTFAAVNLFASKSPPGQILAGEDAFLLDVVLTQGLGAASVAFQGDYGSIGSSSYFGLGVWGKYALAEQGLTLVGRLEYFSDEDAVHTGFLDNGTGEIVDNVFGLTVGANYPVGSNAELKAELRYDKAAGQIYNAEESIATFTVGALAWF